MPEPHVYAVGRPYIPGRTAYPEATQYTYDAGGHELLLILSRPSAREVSAIRSAEAEFALVVDGDLIVFLYRFGDGLPWSDQPYSWHLVPPERRRLPPSSEEIGLSPSAEPRALLAVILVDADTGIVRALRQITLSPALTTALHLAIRDQAARPWPGQAAYDLQLARLYARYPTTDALVSVARARSLGGV